VIRIRHVTLPAGLSVIVRRNGDAGLQVFVSDSLTPDRQRAAVRLALRSMRRPGWRAGLLGVPVGLLSACWRISTPIRRVLRAHAIASCAAAALVAAGAAALIVALPQHHGPSTAALQPGHGQVHASAPGAAPSAAKPGARHSARPAPVSTVVAGRSAGTSPGPAIATPAPSATRPASQPPVPNPSTPAATPQPGTPTPTPVASQPSSGGLTCLVVLGIWVCL
jgi:hypothetical protein